MQVYLRWLGGALLALAVAGAAAAESATEWTERGLALLERGDLEAAAEALERAWQLAPETPALRRALVDTELRLAKERLDAGDPKGAIGPLGLAVELEPRSAAVRFLLGVAYYRTDDAVRARAEALVAVEVEPGHSGAHELLGRIDYNAGRLEEAIPHLEIAAQADPPRAAAVELLARARKELEVERGMASRSSQHFDLRIEGGTADPEAALRIIDVLETAHDAVGAATGLFPRRRVPVILYADRTFSAVTGAHGWVGGLYDGKIRVPLKGLLQKGSGEVDRVLKHEYVHAAIASATARCPAWLHEGLAQLLTGERGDEDAVRRAARAGGLVPFERLGGSFAAVAKRGRAQQIYAQALSFVRYLERRSGRAALGSVVRDLGGGTSLDDALRRSYGGGLEELEALWRAGLEGTD
jgi:tetratricopeptide (TPR) repeat protein